VIVAFQNRLLFLLLVLVESVFLGSSTIEIILEKWKIISLPEKILQRSNRNTDPFNSMEKLETQQMAAVHFKFARISVINISGLGGKQFTAVRAENKLVGNGAVNLNTDPPPSD
jgi:hypothetical protein